MNIKFSFFIHLIIGLASFLNLQAQDQKLLESPYYIFPRAGNQHLDISADWLLSSKDKPIADPSEL